MTTRERIMQRVREWWDEGDNLNLGVVERIWKGETPMANSDLSMKRQARRQGGEVMYKRSICPKFLPGDHAEVLNYRKRPREWEACVVERVEASIGRTSTSLSYAVATERTIPDKYTSGEHPLRLTVGNEWIR